MSPNGRVSHIPSTIIKLITFNPLLPVVQGRKASPLLANGVDNSRTSLRVDFRVVGRSQSDAFRVQVDQKARGQVFQINAEQPFHFEGTLWNRQLG